MRALVYEFPYARGQRRRSSEPCPLSGRELDALRGLADGKVYKEIAEELSLSASTVRTHLHNVYRKIGAVDRAQAVLHCPRPRLDLIDQVVTQPDRDRVGAVAGLEAREDLLRVRLDRLARQPEALGHPAPSSRRWRSAEGSRAGAWSARACSPRRLAGVAGSMNCSEVAAASTAFEISSVGELRAT